MLKDSTNIMMDLVYDKLFDNKEFEQFNCKYSDDECLDYSENEIAFNYNNKKYIIKIMEV